MNLYPEYQKAADNSNHQYQHYRKIRTELRKIKQLNDTFTLGPNFSSLIEELTKNIKESNLHATRGLVSEIEVKWTKENYGN